MNEEERIREEIAEQIYIWNSGIGSISWNLLFEPIKKAYRIKANQILSIKGIRVEADNQDLPKYTLEDYPDYFISHAKHAQHDMIHPKDGDVWVKCEVKEG